MHREFAPETPQQEKQRRCEGPLESLSQAHVLGLAEFTLASRFHGLIQQGREIDPRAGITVNAVGLPGDFFERRGVEAGEHDGAAFVLDETALAVGQHGPVARAHTETDHTDIPFLERVGGLAPVVRLRLTVA